MGYQPIYDGEFDYDYNFPTTQMLEEVFKHKMTVTGFLASGPGGGNPCISLRGTRRQFMAWFNEFYDADHNFFERVENSDAETWENAVEAYGLKFVA